MTSIWEATCQCGNRARVEVHDRSGDMVLKVGCDDHWVELPADRLNAELVKAEASRRKEA